MQQPDANIPGHLMDVDDAELDSRSVGVAETVEDEDYRDVGKGTF